MDNNMENWIGNITDERVIEIANDISSTNEECKNAIIDIIKNYNSLFRLLSVEDKKILDKYEDSISYKETIMYRKIYEQGLRDGIESCKKKIF